VKSPYVLPSNHGSESSVDGVFVPYMYLFISKHS